MPTPYTDVYGNRIYDYGPYEGLTYAQKINIITGGQKTSLSRSESRAFCDSLVTTIEVPVRNEYGVATRLRLTVNKYLAYSYISLFEDIFYNTKFCVKNGATAAYAYRNVAGTGKLSFHSYGAAIDINWNDNPQTKYITGTNSNIQIRNANHPVAILWSKYDWGWGGSWTGTTPDYMHFSYTNE